MTDTLLGSGIPFADVRWSSKVAMQGPGIKVTYEQLGKDTSTVQDALRRENLTRVAISLPFGVAQVVAMCGAIAARAVYVPIDETQAMERNLLIVQTACVQAVLCHAESLWLQCPRQPHLVTPLHVHELVLVTWTDASSTSYSSLHPNPLLEHPDAMYVLFTSGSTGVPKGVVGTRRATLNRLQWMWHAFPFQPHDKVLRSTKLTFVDAIWEILGTLSHGQTLVVVPFTGFTPPLVADLARGLSVIAAFRVTRLTLVPSVLQMLLHAAASFPQTIQTFVVSGETLRPQLLQQALQAAAPTATVLNLYGSTEVGGDVTCASFSRQSTTSDQIESWGVVGVPIGKAIQHTKLMLMDEDGVVSCTRGELWVAGPGLALGYLNPSDTIDKFVHVGSDLWFKTGDECVWRGDVLFYSGRVDSQVKIGGISIHLDAVEACFDMYLHQHFQHRPWHVGAVAISMSKHCLQLDTVVVYVGIAGGAATFTSIHSQAALASLFNGHVVVPVRVVVIERTAFPLTSTGKTHRRQLLELYNQTNKGNKSTPEYKDKLTSILMAHLDMPSSTAAVVDEMTLVELGGNSLVATMVLHDLRTQCGLATLELADVVQPPSP
ncbi:hypothetical protein DYB37_008963 [Aphanomyces astaci]|uniref:AMP-dependent synthetase/ligase domain-containing protein n=2 Tax=Aphanomyces astaci TaxID=112090 RepID=A0A3R7AWC6_APHAT|nr:hypothetical protein DYB35_008862 [Aphanomyces astaci]RHZ19713.1 hypothetical protein DYB37_008963 [Aphanomyces astaci]